MGIRQGLKVGVYKSINNLSYPSILYLDGKQFSKIPNPLPGNPPISNYKRQCSSSEIQHLLGMQKVLWVQSPVKGSQVENEMKIPEKPFPWPPFSEECIVSSGTYPSAQNPDHFAFIYIIIKRDGGCNMHKGVLRGHFSNLFLNIALGRPLEVESAA